MSVIESAIKRARARNAGKGAPSPNPPARIGEAAQARSSAQPRPPAPVVVPAERLQARPIAINRAVCDEQRVLLLEDTTDRNGPAVAAYRILRTRLLQRARLQQWTFIGITSPSVSDGKSLTALNLALSLSRERNTEVVLLDLDMRNPSICRNLGVVPPHHMLEYFEQRISPAELFFSIGVERLMLASGTITTEAASELLGTGLLSDLKEYIRQRSINPIVLIDLPPLLHTDDALVVAPHIDAMLIVASEGRTDRLELNKALEVIGEFPIAGLVLNRGVDTTRPYDYGYGYSRN